MGLAVKKISVVRWAASLPVIMAIAVILRVSADSKTVLWLVLVLVLLILFSVIAILVLAVFNRIK
jgi:hypothetical protein